MKILVIVVTYNGLKWLDRCLGSVRASEVPALVFGVMILSNSSIDGRAKPFSMVDMMGFTVTPQVMAKPL